MTEEKFIETKKFFEETLQFGETDKQLTRLTRSMPQIYQTAIDMFTNQMHIVKELQVQKDKTYSEGFEHYRLKQNRDLSTKEIDILMDSNSSYVKICRELLIQEKYCNYLEHTINNIKSVSFNINNYINVKKFFAGDY